MRLVNDDQIESRLGFTERVEETARSEPLQGYDIREAVLGISPPERLAHLGGAVVCQIVKAAINPTLHLGAPLVHEHCGADDQYPPQVATLLKLGPDQACLDR